MPDHSRGSGPGGPGGFPRRGREGGDGRVLPLSRGRQLGTAIPLSVLDLSPVPSGGTPAQALRNTLDLAQHAEEAGYLRYWVAEHHLADGVASSSPAVLIGAIASVTSHIRVGSGAVQLGHQTPLAVVEAFGTLASLYPGRIDLGLGRSGQRRREERKAAAVSAETKPRESRVVNGLLIPPAQSAARLLKSPWYALQAVLLQQPGAQTPDFAGQVDDIRAFLAGTWRSADGIAMTAVPGARADAEVWILGSSAGQSAQVAGSLGLPFAASYHITPATALEAIEAYRAAFRPGVRPAPHVMVSADVLVAPTDAEARELASGFGPWVRSIRDGAGAIPYPSPAEARALQWTDADRALVEDRLATQFAGSPATVAKSLRIAAEATGADELLVTTITHDHADRVRSLQLLAREWGLG
jgi:alkanesulfonate monooxygenase SsuD/methylene tetrahydromethanopterin reductase-like flavin-dependent oxidoreductase (luciferase family)